MADCGAGPWDASEWDARYAAATSVWGGDPNRWVADELADLPPGRALDLACGEGRNALWLAARGWQVQAVDFSTVALDRGRAAEADTAHPAVDWIHADATTFEPAAPVDLALLCYLHLPAAARTQTLRHVAQALRPGGILLFVAHDARNRTDGVGGPQDPNVLCTAADLVADLAGTGLLVERAGEVQRPVENAARPAIDTLLRARRPV